MSWNRFDLVSLMKGLKGRKGSGEGEGAKKGESCERRVAHQKGMISFHL